jgi:hypothetical protein
MIAGGRAERHVRVTLTLLALLLASPSFGQTPPSFSPDQLIQLVAPVALYPDPLLAQVLAAATFSDQLPEAAHWADQHRKLTGEPLAQAMRAEQLPWDPSVQSLLPFPSVLEAIASDMNRIGQLGNAFLIQPDDVLTAIQSERAKAKEFGYLKSTKRVSVSSPPYIEIAPVTRAQIAVPSYDPGVVFFAPPKAGSVANAIRFDTDVDVGGFQLAAWNSGKFQFIGGYFQPWGWGFGGIDWSKRAVVINGTPWQRNWTNRSNYVHPYPQLTRVPPPE